MTGPNASCMALADKVAIAILAVFISLAVSGCEESEGGGPTPPAPPPPTPAPTPAPVPKVCSSEQAQCTRCENYKCMDCNPGYVYDNRSVPGGRCIASCIGEPETITPSKPSSPLELNGQAWPQMCIDQSTAHFFGIGDWGGVGAPGHTWTNPGRCTEDANDKSTRQCTDADIWAQKYVAAVMGKLAPKSKPNYVLSMGDNFYPGGIEKRHRDMCGTSLASETDPTGQWKRQFDEVYNYPHLQGKPWFSVLGNHDYGGMGFLNGWDQQIFQTWNRKDWVMPAQYWSRRVQYADFAVEYFFLETNVIDSHPGIPIHHQICQCHGCNTSCYGYTENSCHHMLNDANQKSLDMVEKGLQSSTAEWHILVTHFPGLQHHPRIKAAHSKYGIDLVLCGHTHNQQSGFENGMHWIITGAGGGVTTDGGQQANGHDDAYGFVDFTINGTHLQYDMYTWGTKNANEDIWKSEIWTSHKYKPSKQTQAIVV